MKLISMHITGYGKISDTDFTFRNGINTFCEDNGYGKTTIVSFIKAMFYGLAGYKKNSGFMERKHFYPFSGGAFGGSITFESDGKEYRIERTFGEKSATVDTLTVYQGADPTEELGDVPGVKVFGLNLDSFERMLCIDADKIELESSSDMNKKLNNYVENVSEDFDIDAVLKTIKDSRKECKDRAKELSMQLKNTEEEVRKLEYDKHVLDGRYAVLSDAQKQKELAEKEYSKASQQAALLEKWKNYDEKLYECKELEGLVKELENKYIKGIPDKKQTLEIIERSKQRDSDESALKACSVSDDIISEHSRIKMQYKKGFPTQECIDNTQSLISKLDECRRLYSEKKNALQNYDMEQLDYHFGGKTVPCEKIAELEEQKKEYDALGAELQTIDKKTIDYRKVEIPAKVANKGFIALLIIIGVLLAASGIGVFFISKPVGAILLTLGAAALVCGFVWLAISKKEPQTQVNNEPYETDNPLYAQKLAELDKVRNDLVNEIAFYRYRDSDPGDMLHQLKTDAAEYEKLLESRKNDENVLAETEQSAKETIRQLDAFFADCGIKTDDYNKALDVVKNDKTSFRNYEKQINDSSCKQNELNESIRRCEEVNRDFYKQYDVPSEVSLQQVIKDIEEHERLKLELKKRSESAGIFAADNELKERPENTDISLDELDRIMQDKKDLYTRIEHEVSDLEEKVAFLDDKKARAAQLAEDLTDINNKADLLDEVKDDICGADQSLKDKYIAPVRDRFCKYADLIEKVLGDKVQMNKDFRISFERQGALRSYEHLSSGNLAVCALCFRLALLDNMFSDDQPLLIMDDPFVSLDSEHLKRTGDLLEKLSENRQILYFCCHKSRKIQ